MLFPTPEMLKALAAYEELPENRGGRMPIYQGPQHEWTATLCSYLMVMHGKAYETLYPETVYEVVISALQDFGRRAWISWHTHVDMQEQELYQPEKLMWNNVHNSFQAGRYRTPRGELRNGNTARLHARIVQGTAQAQKGER